MTKERIQRLLKAGANVVLTTKGIDDMALKVSFYRYLILQLLYIYPICIELAGMIISILYHATTLPEVGCMHWLYRHLF